MLTNNMALGHTLSIPVGDLPRTDRLYHATHHFYGKEEQCIPPKRDTYD